MKIPKDKHEILNFLKAEDMKETTEVKIIEKITLETLKNTGETYILHLEKCDKSLPLNKSNLRTLVQLYGDETDNWIGKPIMLCKVYVNNPTTKRMQYSIALAKPD